jgi:hypothetical protein
LEDQRWLEFTHGHPRASVFHTPGWLQALHRTYGYEPIVYTTSPPGATLTNGIVFCRINSWLTGRRMVSLPFADHCEPLVEQQEDREELFGCLRSAVEKWKYIEIRPLCSGLLSEPGLETADVFCLHVLDLRPDLEILFRNLQKDSIQRKIRRARQQSLYYDEGRSEALLTKFYQLFLMTRRRHNLPPQPIEWFQSLATCLGDQLKIHVAFKDGRAIASILTLRHRDTLVYKYGCSDASYHNLGGMPFLFWKAIQEAKERGMLTFDLGRSDSADHGLITFKDRWGTTRSTLAYGRFCARQRQNEAEGYPMQFAKRVFARLPDGLLIAAGRLLYRHVG